jgi:hypothetical protein
MLWYPNMSPGMNECLLGNDGDYPDFMNTYEGFLFGTLEGCCGTHDCSDMVDGVQTDATIPVATEATTTTTTTTTTPTTTTTTTTTTTSDPNVYYYPDMDPTVDQCHYGSEWKTTHPWMEDYPGQFLFDTLGECCAAHGCTQEDECIDCYWYPAMGTDNKCVFDAQYRDFMKDNPGYFLFDTLELCCASHNCDDMNNLNGDVESDTPRPSWGPTLSPSKEPTPSPTKEPTPNPTKEPTGSPIEAGYWYPDIHANGNLCIYGNDYPAWMDTDAQRSSNLYGTNLACCRAHNCDPGTTPSDEDPNITDEHIASVALHVMEDFENGMDTQPWIHGGNAQWHISSSKSVSGTHSLRSGDLNGQRNKSTDLTLRVDSSRGGFLKFYYWSLAYDPYDYFSLDVDGSIKHMEMNPMADWRQYSLGVEPGVHEIRFRVVAPEGQIVIPRDVSDALGTGEVFIDDLEFIPL